MYQDVTLAADASMLTWDMQYTNHEVDGFSGTQFLAVHVRDLADVILQTLFITTEGVDPPIIPMTSFSADISAFAGMTVRIDVEMVVREFFFDAAFDNFVTTVMPSADLVITKSDSADPVLAGNNLTYTVTVQNNGPSDAQDVQVSDTLPAGVILLSTAGCAEDPAGVPACSLGTIAAGASAQYTVTVAVGSGTTGSITNTATVSSSTPLVNPGDDTVMETTTVNSQADLVITKSDSPDPVLAGDQLTYTVTVQNNGPSDAQDVQVSDTLPAGVTLVSTAGCAEDPGGVPACSLGTIAAGASAQYTITVTVDSDTTGSLTNEATVSSSTPLVNVGDDTVMETTTANAQADLSLAKSDSPDPLDAGAALTYTLDVSNNGPSTATGVMVFDVLPDGTSLNSGSSDPSCSQPAGLVGLRAVMDGNQVVPPSGSAATGLATLVLDTGTDELKFALHVQGFTNAITSATLRLSAGDALVHTLYNGAPPTLDNTNPVSGVLQLSATEAAALQVPGSHYIDVRTGVLPGGEIRGGVVAALAAPVLCNVGTINTGGNSNVDVVADVASAVGAGTTLRNVAIVMSTTGDPNAAPLPVGELSGDTALAETTVAARADLVITKSDSADPVVAGNNLTYTVTVQNNGPSDAQAVQVSDALPAGVILLLTSGCAEDPAGVPACSLGTIGAGSSAQYTVTVAVGSGTTGSITNTATVSSSTPLINPGDDTVMETTAVNSQADLVIAKSDSPDPVVAGSNLTYTVTVQNNGPSDAQTVQVSDTLPAGVTPVSTAGCAEDPGGVPTCSLGPIAAGSSAQYTITVAVGSAATGSITNTATVGSSTPLINTADDTVAEATTVNSQADLVITKSDSPDPVVAGNNLTYTVAVQNDGPSDAQNVQVSDTLPAGVTLVSTAGCAEDPGGVPACSLGPITAGASAQYTITVTVDPDTTGSLINTATVSSSTPLINTADDTVTETTTVNGQADLVITKSDSPDPVLAGDNLTYTVTVQNDGPSDAQNVQVSDTLPAGVTLVSTAGCAEDPAGVPACSLGTIAAGASAQYTITVTVDSATTGSLINTATVSSSTPLVNTADDTVMETTTVNSQADLMITKSDSPDPVVAGNNLTYTVTVQNNGPSDAQNVQVNDTLPAGVTLVSTAGCAEDPAGVPACSLGTIAAGASAQYTVTVTVDSSTLGAITNQATVTSDTTDPDPANNTATEDTTVVSTANLSVTKSDSQDPVPAGAPLSYTVTVSNAGPSDALNVAVSDTLPAGVTLVSTSGCLNDPNAVPTCDLGTIAAGATAQYTIDVTVDPSTTGTITNTLSVSSDTSDPDASDNTASEDTLVDESPPTVVLVHSTSDTGDGELEKCENTKVNIRQLLVTFSEDVRDPPGDDASDDVTNPANFLLIASGPDKDFATSVCGPALGDDQVIAIDAVAYDSPTQTATLDVNGGSVLGDSLYRLLVCGSIRDIAGSALDGDGNGTASDFLRTYRIDRANFFENADFDCTIEDWITVTSLPQEIEHSPEDIDESLVSGSARVTNLSSSTDFSLGQCVAVPPLGYRLGSRIRIDAVAGVLLSVSRTCEFFALAGCTGPSLAIDVNAAFLEDTAGSWLFLESVGTAPAGAVSALCSYDLRNLTGGSFDAFLDSTTLTFGFSIFSDGFESGDTSAWSTTPGAVEP